MHVKNNDFLSSRLFILDVHLAVDLKLVVTFNGVTKAAYEADVPAFKTSVTKLVSVIAYNKNNYGYIILNDLSSSYYFLPFL